MGKKINETMKKMIETIQHDWKQPWGNVLSIMKRDTLGDAEDLATAMTVLIDKGKWLCPIREEHGDDAYYSISKDEIVVPEASQFACADDFYGEVLHNMAHSTGAESCLFRLKPCSFGYAQYSHEELVAELSAACIMQMFGLDKRCKEDSLPYIKSWLDQMEEDDEWLNGVLTEVCKVVGFIVTSIKRILGIETYTAKGIRQLLADMAEYALGCEEQELQDYFEQMTETGLFHDAIGKVVKREENKVIVTTSY